MLVFFLFFLLGVFVFWSLDNVGWFGSFFLLSYPWSGLEFCFVFDMTSLLCVYMLFCCGFIALFYCYHYFSSDESGKFLFFLICWFLGVMFFLMISDSMIFSLVAWEYLGLVSFFLILFYSNMISLRASLVTLFASRFGDVSLFVLVFWVLSDWDFSVTFCMLLFFLVILTKSACYPFISWLIEAMRAPTPVSSLVHSSTLVAAGVWFLFRYDYFFDFSFLSVLLLLAFVSIFVSGLCACVFVDLKKIVALSTCNNVSWCVVFYVCGDLSLALLQLLTHGVCKCFLFMSVGDVMSGSLSSQDCKSVYMFRYNGLFGAIAQFVLVFSLCGLPFLGVFFGKHGLLSLVFYSYGLVFLFVLLACFTLSYIYSFRFYLLLLGDCLGSLFGFLSNFCMIAGLVILSSFLNYGGFFLLPEVVLLGGWQSFLVFFIQVFGSMVGFFLWFNMFVSDYSLLWSSCLGYSDYVVSMFYSMSLKISSFFVLCLYRWEVLVLKFFHSKVLGNFSFLQGGFLLSLNFIVCGIVVSMLCYVLLVVVS